MAGSRGCIETSVAASGGDFRMREASSHLISINHLFDGEILLSLLHWNRDVEHFWRRMRYMIFEHISGIALDVSLF